MNLRPYQSRAIEQLRARIHERPCLQLATGAGKTIIFSEILRLYTQRHKRSLLLVHRDELVKQAVAKLQAVGVTPGVIKAGYDEDRSHLVQVASVQTLIRRELPDAGMVIIDEAHHVPSDGYQHILAGYPNALLFGVTATPYRLDGKGLGKTFGCIISPISMRELIDQGYLIQPKLFSHPIDIGKVRKQAGDYKNDDLAVAVNKPKLIGSVVSEWKRLAWHRRTVCFAVNVAHSKAIVEAFTAAGIPAEHLDGTTPADERAAALWRLETGETLVVSNCSLFGEGFDLPSLSCAVLARPTMSRSLCFQQIGRIMRPEAGKLDAIVLDHGGCLMEHGLPWDTETVSLDDRVKANRPAPLQRCPRCFIIVDPPQRVCPQCGHEREPVVAVPTHADGDLEEFDGQRPLSMGESRLACRLLRHLTTCEDKGHKEGYAKFLFKKDYGFLPKGRIIEAARCMFQAGTRIRDPASDPSVVVQAP